MHHSPTDRGYIGFWVYLMSDCVLFASLFALYAVLHAGAPSSASLFDLSFVLEETLVLLSSSFACGLALVFAQRGRKGLALAFLALTLALGLSFLYLEISEFAALIALGHGPAASAALSSYFTLVGTHGLHVALGSLWLLVLLARVATRGLEGALGQLTYFSLFWHFLDIIWIFIFTIVYLMGSL